MEEIKVGEYVRSLINGEINKVSEIRDLLEEPGVKYYKFDDFKGFCSTEIDSVKHSFNIIDLLDNGDMAVIEYYVSKYRHRIRRIFEVGRSGNVLIFENIHCEFEYDKEQNKWLDGYGFKPKIVGVVTREEFERAMYEVK